MNRWPAVIALILANLALQLTGCAKTVTKLIPPADASLTIAQKLDRLVEIRQEKGFPVGEAFNPGLTQDQIAALTGELPFKLPAAFIQLYMWRNGAAADGPPFALFRDQRFLPLEQALEQRVIILANYPFSTWTVDRLGKVDLRECVPFASVEGSTWAVCSQPYFKLNPVISVFEGVELFFWSFDHMLDTMIEWYAQGTHSAAGVTVPPDLELTIWKEHNRGVFG